MKRRDYHVEYSSKSSFPMLLETWLRTPLRSPLPVLLKACRMVSILSSLPNLGPKLGETGLCVVESGLPGSRPLRFGETSSPLTDVEILVGGEVLNPYDDVGERSGDGDLFCDNIGKLPENVVAGRTSRLGNSSFVSTCSALTTSANETKLKRRTEVVSRAPCVTKCS